jgi:hypothetical protein
MPPTPPPPPHDCRIPARQVQGKVPAGSSGAKLKIARRHSEPISIQILISVPTPTHDSKFMTMPRARRLPCEVPRQHVAKQKTLRSGPSPSFISTAGGWACSQAISKVQRLSYPVRLRLGLNFDSWTPPAPFCSQNAVLAPHPFPPPPLPSYLPRSQTLKPPCRPEKEFFFRALFRLLMTCRAHRTRAASRSYPPPRYSSHHQLSRNIRHHHHHHQPPSDDKP